MEEEVSTLKQGVDSKPCKSAVWRRMLRRSNGGGRWWDSNLAGSLGDVQVSEGMVSKRHEELLREARESRAVADLKSLDVVVDMGRDANKQGVIVLHSGPLLGRGENGWRLAFVLLVAFFFPASGPFLAPLCCLLLPLRGPC